jgi:hypothetical protein
LFLLVPLFPLKFKKKKNMLSNSNAIISEDLSNDVFIKIGTNRLHAQGLKQSELAFIFQKNCKAFKVPKVLASSTKNELRMELILKAQPIPLFLSVCSPSDVVRLFETIQISLEVETKLSEMVPVKKIICFFQDKIESLQNQIPHRFHIWFTKVIQLLSVHNEELMPIGPCHGDMTLCNLLYSSKNTDFYAVDMLDVFLDSPLQDVAALMQDLRYKWFEFIQGTSKSSVRTDIYLNYLEHRLVQLYYDKQDILDAFLIMKLLRIIPYSKSNATEEWVFSTLKLYGANNALQPSMLALGMNTTGHKIPDITLIVPAAGRSSRFPNMRPKFLLTQPNGSMMIEEAICGLPLAKFGRIIVIVLKQHLGPAAANRFLTNLRLLDSRIELFQLEEPTGDVVEAVSVCAQKLLVKGTIMVKDCDNSFDLCLENDCVEFGLCAVKSNEVKDQNGNKCAVITPENASNVILNLYERDPSNSGNAKCVSGYIVDCSCISHFPIPPCHERERTMSDVLLFSMLWIGSNHVLNYVQNYQDWGTCEAWQSWRARYQTFFIDLDGTMFFNTGGILSDVKWGENEPLKNNLAWFHNLPSTSFIIFVTSRPESARNTTISQLQKYNIRFDHLIMNLPHSCRILINDHSVSTNPFPAAIAFSVPRDADNLQQTIKDLGF